MTTTAKRRTKRPALTIKNIEEAEGLLAEMAVADARLRRLKAEMDEQITEVRKRYDADIATLQEDYDSREDVLWAFAESNQQLFEKKKSLDLTHGVIGFRTGTHKLKPLLKSWDAIVAKVKAKCPQFLRVKEEVAKDRLLDCRDLPEVKELLPQIGVAVVQDETFFVELKAEGAE